MICKLEEYKRDEVTFDHFPRQQMCKDGFTCLWTSEYKRPCLDRADQTVQQPEEGDSELAFTAQYIHNREHYSLWVR